MKGELSLSEEAYGVAFSAFFWIYAPVQLFAGWLCDRFSVYKLMAGGILLWAGSTLLMGFAGGFASLLMLRVMLGVGESISFPGSSKIIARHVPAGAPRCRQCRGRGRHRARSGGRYARRRIDRRALGLARDVLRLRRPRPCSGCCHGGARSGICPRPAIATRRAVPVAALISQMAVVVDVDRPRLGNYGFYFLLAWLPCTSPSRAVSRSPK